jgi:hypothetical protein
VLSRRRTPARRKRAVDEELGRLVEIFVAAKVGPPALLAGREPGSLALGVLRDQATPSTGTWRVEDAGERERQGDRLALVHALF